MVPLVPCTTTSPALGLMKYASAYEIRRQRGQVRRGGIGELRVLHFFFFLCLANECLSFPQMSSAGHKIRTFLFHPYFHTSQRCGSVETSDKVRILSHFSHLYFTKSASFQLTKLTGLTCSFRYQKPTDKRLNLLTQKPLCLHVTLNILDD